MHKTELGVLIAEQSLENDSSILEKDSLTIYNIDHLTIAISNAMLANIAQYKASRCYTTGSVMADWG